MRNIFRFFSATALLGVSLLAAKNTSCVGQVMGFSPMALNSYSIAPAKIVSAAVTDLNGDTIGRVLMVRSDRQGKPEGLDIWLSATGKTLNVTASNVSYDEEHNVVTLDFSRIQLTQMYGDQEPRAHPP